jgi:phosphate:Na+ symporter
LHEARAFLSQADPPPSEEGHAWFTSTVHALDHASRLAEAVNAMAKTGLAMDGPEEVGAAALCARSMGEAAEAAASLARAAGPGHAADDDLAKGAARKPAKDAVVNLERDAGALADFKTAHRRGTLEMVASGKLIANAAIARVDAVALLNRLAHHAWRAIAHLEVAAALRMELDQ